MTTSNLVTILTATLPSATSTTLGGVLIDSTASGLLAMSDGHIAVKYSTGLQIDSGGHLYVDSTQFLTVGAAGSTYATQTFVTNTYLPLSGGLMTGNLVVKDVVSGNNIETDVSSSGAFLHINPGNPTGGGGIIFTDSTEQNTAYNPFAVYSLNGAVNNIGTLISTLSSGDPILASGQNCLIIDYTTLQTGTINLDFPQPSSDGQAIELVIINGSGTYTASGVALDGVTSTTFYLNLGTGAYTQGVFRYIDSTKTWYQVS